MSQNNWNRKFWMWLLKVHKIFGFLYVLWQKNALFSSLFGHFSRFCSKRTLTDTFQVSVRLEILTDTALQIRTKTANLSATSDTWQAWVKEFLKELSCHCSEREGGVLVGDSRIPRFYEVSEFSRSSLGDISERTPRDKRGNLCQRMRTRNSQITVSLKGKFWAENLLYFSIDISKVPYVPPKISQLF